MNTTEPSLASGPAAPSSAAMKRVIYIGVPIVVIAVLWLAGLLPLLFGVLIPYATLLIFIGGFIHRIVVWSRSPVPFRITTTSGQQQSLPWIKQNKLDNPSTLWGVIGRMALEILFFRSLFRNTKMELKSGPKLAYGSDKYLWAAALAFHWCILIIFLRHIRFFTEPVPAWTLFLQDLDGIFQVGLPILYMTDIVILGALGFLLFRRIYDAKIRYMSLPSDYLALFLILAVVLSGVLMRHVFKTDIVEVKRLAIGLLTLSPSLEAAKAIGVSFYIHFFLICLLLAYFPFSKLMHMPGVFMSPTRNLANNNRMKRHINPWNAPVKVHTYEEYEEEFRDKMKAAGLPLEKD